MLYIDFQPNELEMRAGIVETAAALRLRHAHMVGVARSSLWMGLSTDPHRIAQLASAIRLRIRPNSKISVRSPSGTNLCVEMQPWGRWYETSGIIRSGTKVNLPAGELVSSPAAVDGVYIADGAVGDDGGISNRTLYDQPLRVEFEKSIVRKITSQDRGLAELIVRMMGASPNLNRVGQVNFGTNVGLLDRPDDIFTWQKVPGLHVTMGVTFPTRTGASWTADHWIAFTAGSADIDIDNSPVMRAGRYQVAG